jgi:hypothetical protein
MPGFDGSAAASVSAFPIPFDPDKAAEASD